MRRGSGIFAAACFGAFLLVGAANAAPISAAGALNSLASKAAIDQALPEQSVQDVRWRGYHRRHWGWNRGRHYGWQHHRWHRYGWYPHRRLYY
ncbi:MAG: twin-arginine translocation (Tat) [Xanthobacteraceae bacterium]